MGQGVSGNQVEFGAGASIESIIEKSLFGIVCKRKKGGMRSFEH